MKWNEIIRITSLLLPTFLYITYSLLCIANLRLHARKKILGERLSTCTCRKACDGLLFPQAVDYIIA